MGFKATEQVEELTYDFAPHVTGKKASGTIPEPPSKAIEDYRDRLVAAFKATGLDPETAEAGFSLDQMDEVLALSKEVEEAMLNATADLTGIAHDTLRALPYRVQRAFLGWVMGQFFDPES